MIEARGIEVAFGSHTVLQGVDLSAEPSRMTGLVGPNGSGKTTLLRTLYGSLTPDAGTVTLGGRDLRALSAAQVARDVAVVIQEPATDLPYLVSDMVLLGRNPHQPAFGRLGEADHRIAAEALTRTGALHLAARPFAVLSGGEKQRVLMARALTQEPSCLLMDEPTNHLDVRYQHEVLGIARGLDAAVVVVLHDLNLAARYCDKVTLLDEGVAVASGTPDEVLVPELLEPIYEMTVRRVSVDGEAHLIFRPDIAGTAARVKESA